jgi:lysyl-tRNA synthetase class 2
MVLREDWRPGAALSILKLRARLLAAIREFFADRGILEVETPYLSAAATPAPHLASYRVEPSLPGSHPTTAAYLHTSPEFPMKRLLAAGCPDIYQICRVFRQNERGALHNPEFTLIEWYRRGFGYRDLMDEVADLVRGLEIAGVSQAPAERMSYSELFRHYLGIDPLRASIEELAECAEGRQLHPVDRHSLQDRDDWLDLLLTHCVEPQLPRDRLVFVCEYPATQAALARLSPDDARVAERFELYLNGVELANGFGELGDASEQRTRFEAERVQRRTRGLPEMLLDERFLAALQHGLPVCSGVALGFDRLVMLAARRRSLDEVMAFSASRA